MADRQALRGSVRFRIIGWYTALVAVAVVLAFAVNASYLRSRVMDNADGELDRIIADFQAVAGGTDDDGEPLGGDIQAIADRYLATRVAQTGVGVIVFSQGEPLRSDIPAGPWVKAGTFEGFAVVDERERGTIDGPDGDLRFLAAPVAATDQAAGTVLGALELPPRLAEANRAILWSGLGWSGGLLLVSLLAWWSAGRVLSPLRRLRDTAATISESDLASRIEVTGDGELADLAASFNGMLDRLQEAFDSQRRFVDDAGHELRTPITVIRGQLDTMGPDPDDRAQVMSLVDEELERMSRIVEDLLVLAQAEHRAFIRTAPIDLDDFVHDVLLRAETFVEGSVVDAGSPPVVVRADDQRLMQAMLNLVRNADVHTGPDTTIAVGATTRADGQVHLWVHDDGPGIPSDQLDHVVQRFGRASAGPRTGGAGLGLAIVDVIARAHGGRLTIDSAPGSTRIGLTIPAHEDTKGDDAP